MPGKSFSRIYLWQILSAVEHVVIEREFFLSLSLQHRKDTFGWINCKKTELPCQGTMNVWPTLSESVSFSLSQDNHLPYECGLASWVLAHHHHQGLRLKVWILQHWRVEVMVVVLLLHFTGDFSTVFSPCYLFKWQETLLVDVFQTRSDVVIRSHRPLSTPTKHSLEKNWFHILVTNTALIHMMSKMYFPPKTWIQLETFVKNERPSNKTRTRMRDRMGVTVDWEESRFPCESNFNWRLRFKTGLDTRQRNSMSKNGNRRSSCTCIYMNWKM